MPFEFTAYSRNVQGKGASRRLRRTGKTPGIVYGSVDTPQAIELDHNALSRALKQEGFHSSILNMSLAGKKEQVLLRDVQMHPFRDEVLHVDFQRIDENRKIHVKVPLHFINAAASPAVKLSAAIINHVLAELDISCLPKDLPEFIEVDLINLTAGHSIHLKDLQLPSGVTPVIHGRETNPVVANAIIPRTLEEEDAAAVAAAEAAAATEAAAAAEAAPAAAATTPAKEEKGKEKK